MIDYFIILQLKRIKKNIIKLIMKMTNLSDKNVNKLP